MLRIYLNDVDRAAFEDDTIDEDDDLPLVSEDVCDYSFVSKILLITVWSSLFQEERVKYI